MSEIDRLMGRAIDRHRAGDLSAAAALYADVLTRRPDLADAHHLLGLVEHQRGGHAAGLRRIRHAIRIAPDNPTYHANLGLVLVAAGDLAAAEASFRRALALRPNQADVMAHLGSVLALRGAPEEAEACFVAARRARPDDGALAAKHAETLLTLGRLDAAVAAFRGAVAGIPDDPTLFAALASTLQRLGRTDDAVDAYATALQLKPDYVPAMANMASALRDRGDIETALALCRRALEIAPDQDDVRAVLASVCERQGDVAAARAALQPALDRGSGSALVAAAHVSLADRPGGDAAAVAAALRLGERCLAADGHGAAARQQLHFALAGLYDRTDKVDRAFGHYVSGNRLTAARFDPAAHRQSVTDLLTAYADFARLPRAANAWPKPVFIVGMPRSGTSLVEQILASHPAVHGAGELPDIRDLSRDLPLAYPAQVGGFTSAQLDDIAARQVGRLTALAGAAERVVDKQPANALRLGLIAQLFPAARVIHCRRDPLDTCWSCFSQNFGERLPYSTGFDTLAAYYADLERVMAHWQTCLGPSILTVAYEDLIDDPEGVSRRMIAFLDLDWDPACLRFYENRRFVRTASYDQVRRPIYRGAVGRWRRYAGHLAPLAAALDREGVAHDFDAGAQ